MASTSGLAAWDYVAIVTYFILVLCAGLYSLCRSNRGTVSGYFLAGRYMIWLPVGASLFASNIGSEHFVGLAGSGAAAGLGVAAFEFNACLLVQLLGWVFLPVYIASGVYTLPEYMKKRYGGQRVRVFLAMLSLVLYIFTKISVDLYSGALFIQETLNWNLYGAIFLLLALTAICTVTGGLAAVIYTDTLQFFIMIIGAAILSALSFAKVGGYQELKVKYMDAISNDTRNNLTGDCGFPREDSWQMLREPIGSDMPWAGFLFGQTVASIWYWCADQMMVQRALAAKSLSHAQGGCLLAGFIKLLPMFLMVLPGMISRVLFPNELACASAESCMEVCGSSTGCSNLAYPKLVIAVMPTGLKGVMLAVMLAALMSDLTSIFNSTSTLFTIDIWKYFRAKFSKKEPNVRELMVVGSTLCGMVAFPDMRNDTHVSILLVYFYATSGFGLVVVIMVIVAILWIPIIQQMQGGQLFHYIQEVSAYLSPPIAACYLVAILWPRGNEKGCFWGLVAGFVVGIIRMILDFIWRAPPCWGEDRRPAITAKVHYMYFALILFWITVIVDVVVSLLTAPPDPQKLIRTTWWSRFDSSARFDDFEDDKDEIELPAKTDPDEEDDKNVRIIDQENKNPCRRGYDWFCGYDDTLTGQVEARKHQEHLKKITSLKQNPKAKIFLNLNLVIILLVATTLYVYFSIPNTRVTSVSV